MKHIKLKILDSSLKEVLEGEFTVHLHETANILNLISEIDATRKGRLFIEKYPEYQSLLHLMWNPIENRFYKQIALSAYTKNQKFLEVRKDPWLVLPGGSTVFLGLGLCKSESEEVVDFEIFQKMMKSSLARRESIPQKPTK